MVLSAMMTGFSQKNTQTKSDSIKDDGCKCNLGVPDQEIDLAIERGLRWLVDKQDAGGSWGGIYRPAATTAFVLIKLQYHAWEQEIDPFDENNYEYAQKVISGWRYLFTHIDTNGKIVQSQELPPQHNTDPDAPATTPYTDAINNRGIYLREDDENLGQVYETGIFLMALVASGNPYRLTTDYGASIYPGGTTGDINTFGEMAQDVVDWLTYAQGDKINNFYNYDSRGGYAYYAIDDHYRDEGEVHKYPDNSNSGYAYMGLAGARSTVPDLPSMTAFGCKIHDWVEEYCGYWVEAIQYYDPTSDKYGGSAYRDIDYCDDTNDINTDNLLKTGNLIFEMKFCGMDTTPRFTAAIGYDATTLIYGYINRYWQADIGNAIWPKGWGYTTDHIPPCTSTAHYQAMWCLMKGFMYNNIPTIDLTPLSGSPTQDWYNEDPAPSSPPYSDFANVIVVQQKHVGTNKVYWELFNGQGDTANILATVWALLTLEKAPPFTEDKECCPKLSKIITSHEEGDCVKPREYIKYKICYYNDCTNPPMDFIGIQFIDKLPTGTVFQEFAGYPSNPDLTTNIVYNPSTHWITWSISTINSHETYCWEVKVLVPSDIPDGTTLTNEVTSQIINPSDPDGIICRDTQSISIDVCGGDCIDVGIAPSFSPLGSFAYLENTCLAPSDFVAYSIHFEGGLATQRDFNGTIEAPAKNETVAFGTGELMLGLGITKVTVNVAAESGCCHASASATGFLFGPFMYTFTT